MSLVISFEGREFGFDKEAISITEWRELKRKYGMTPKKWDETIPEADPDASTFLYWVMLRQNGDQRVPLGDQLVPDIIALNNAVATAISTEAEAEPDPTAADPDVTRRASPRSNGSATATSAPSATSISSPSPGTAISEPPA